MPKKQKIRIYIIAIISFGLIAASFYNFHNPLSVDIQTSSNPKVDNAISININTSMHLKPYSFESIDVNIAHKYNSNEQISFTVSPYEEGKYQIIYVPNYTGEYLINVEIKDDSNSQLFQSSFVVT